MRHTTMSAIALAAALTLTGCTAGSSSEQSADSAPQLIQPGQPGQAPAVEDASGGFTDKGGSGAIDVDRQVVTTGTMTVTADDPIDAAGEAVRIAEAAGGRVDARTENAPVDGDRGSATLTLRLPSKTLSASLEKLRALGEVEEVALSATDVTTESQDLAARTNALRASVNRLTALLTTAVDTEVLIKLETAISERQGQLESLEAQQRYLADQVSLSRLDLSLISTTDAPADRPDTFLSGLAAGWEALLVFGTFLLVAVGVILPWLALAGILALIALALRRRWRRKAAVPAAETPAA